MSWPIRRGIKNRKCFIVWSHEMLSVPCSTVLLWIHLLIAICGQIKPFFPRRCKQINLKDVNEI